jgi:hypothetical protein
MKRFMDLIWATRQRKKERAYGGARLREAIHFLAPINSAHHQASTLRVASLLPRVEITKPHTASIKFQIGGVTAN